MSLKSSQRTALPPAPSRAAESVSDFPTQPHKILDGILFAILLEAATTIFVYGLWRVWMTMR